MAGNRFIKKLQALKSRMMFEDTPVDPSRRKLFTLPPEETSQSLPVPQTSKPESLLNQLANKPVDRREFLKQAGQSAKSAAVRGILPELGKLVEPAVKKALPQPTDFSLVEAKLKDALSKTISDQVGESDYFLPGAFSIIRNYVDSSKFKASELKKLDKLNKLVEEGNFDAAYKLEEALYEMVDHLKPGTALDVLHQVVTEHIPHEDLPPTSVAHIIKHYGEGDVPDSVIHDYLDTHHPDYDEESVNMYLKDPSGWIP